MFHRQWTHTVVAILVGTVDRSRVQGVHFVDGRRLGIQTDRSGRSSPQMGRAQEQTENELRETESRPALLLRQEHYTQDGRQKIRVQIRL